MATIRPSVDEEGDALAELRRVLDAETTFMLDVHCPTLMAGASGAGARWPRVWLQQESHRVLVPRNPVHHDGVLADAFNRESQSLVQPVCWVLDGDVQLESCQAPGGGFVFDERVQQAGPDSLASV